MTSTGQFGASADRPRQARDRRRATPTPRHTVALRRRNSASLTSSKPLRRRGAQLRLHAGCGASIRTRSSRSSRLFAPSAAEIDQAIGRSRSRPRRRAGPDQPPRGRQRDAAGSGELPLLLARAGTAHRRPASRCPPRHGSPSTRRPARRGRRCFTGWWRGLFPWPCRPTICNPQLRMSAMHRFATLDLVPGLQPARLGAAGPASGAAAAKAAKPSRRRSRRRRARNPVRGQGPGASPSRPPRGDQRGAQMDVAARVLTGRATARTARPSTSTPCRRSGRLRRPLQERRLRDGPRGDDDRCGQADRREPGSSGCRSWSSRCC